MTAPAIVDTNVVIAGLLTDNDDSPVVRILEGMLGARFAFVVSEALLVEYRNVLHRPALRRAHGLSADEIDTLVIALAENAIVLTPVVTTASPDPGDQHLWELLAARPDLCLVTGDKRLFEQGPNMHRIRTPRDFEESRAEAKR